MNDKSKPYRFRFSLRTLFLVVLVLSIPLAFIGNRIARVKQQQKIIAPLMKYDPGFSYSWNGYIKSLAITGWYSPPGVRRPPPLKDNDLATVAKLHKLQRLYLVGNNITDDGLEHLKDMHNLSSLTLVGIPITDEGMALIAGLDCLEHLEIRGPTKVTDDGLAILANANQLKSLELTMLVITDDKLEHLSKLTNLESLNISGGKYPEESISKLQRALPDCEIGWWDLSVISPAH